MRNYLAIARHFLGVDHGNRSGGMKRLFLLLIPFFLQAQSYYVTNDSTEADNWKQSDNNKIGLPLIGKEAHEAIGWNVKYIGKGKHSEPITISYQEVEENPANAVLRDSISAGKDVDSLEWRYAVNRYNKDDADKDSKKKAENELSRTWKIEQWQAGNPYQVDDECMFGDDRYIVIQAHTAQTGWEPPKVPALFNLIPDNRNWAYPVKYYVDDGVTYDGKQYFCIQEHTSQVDWTPPNTPALWKAASTGGCSEWIQPTGAHDAYNIGDCVKFEGKCYESTIDGNVWSPTAYPAGWRQIECK